LKSNNSARHTILFAPFQDMTKIKVEQFRPMSR
jgi:hypothetical protein